MAEDFSVKNTIGGIATNTQRKHLVSDLEENVKNNLFSGLNNSGKDAPLADVEEDFAQFMANYLPDEGQRNLYVADKVQEYSQMATADQAMREVNGETNKKADRYARDMQHEFEDNVKHSGYRGGYQGGYQYEHQNYDSVNVLDHLGTDSGITVAERDTSDETLKKLGFKVGEEDGIYTYENGAYGRSYVNEKGQNVKNYIKMLTDKDGNNYLVSTNITENKMTQEDGTENISRNVKTNAYSINKNATLTLITDPAQIKKGGELGTVKLDEKYNALTDEQKGQVDAQVKNQNWESVYKDFKDGKDDLSNWSQTFQNVGWQPELADAMQEQVKQNVDIISQVDANDGKITNADRERLEKAGIQMTDLSKMLGKPIVNAETRDSIPPLLNENKPQEDKGVPEERKLEE